MTLDRGVDWTVAYEEHAAAVFGLARVILGNAEDAADVAQATFERAVRNERRYDRSRPLRPWLMGIASHEALGQARRRRRFAWAPLLGTETAYEAPQSGSPVWEAVASLPAGHRAAIALFHLYGYSLNEVAAILGVPAGTVGSRLFTARGRLRQILGEDEGSGRT